MVKFYKLVLIFFFFLAGFLPVFAQKYEAESATLTGGAAKQVCTGCSGGYFVAQGEGNLTFAITLPKEGFYNVFIRAASTGGNKINEFGIGENTLDFSLSSSQYITLKLVAGQKLASGPHEVKINKSWGWINIDYIEFEQINEANRFNLTQTLVSGNPTPQAKSLFDFLLDNYGDKIISGVMTLNSMDEPNWLKENTGKEPALLGIDFLHSGRGYTWYDSKTPIKDAAAWYRKKGIPALMWHWRDPSRKTEEFYLKGTSRPNGTEFDVSKVSDVNSQEYKAMLADIDYVAELLKELQDQNVPVIWRPLHEAAGGWFWWGAKGGEPLKMLWRLLYDRMVNHHGLKNLIWVWTREPNDDTWYPGDGYVDIVGRDIYKDGDHSSQTLEFSDMNSRYGGKKMLTLSEVGSFPDVENLLKDEPAWSWFMPWYGGYTRDSQYNSLDLWKKMLAHDYVITLDEMPDLSTYVRQDQVITGIKKNQEPNLSLKAYPTFVKDYLTIKSDKRISTIEVYTLLGTFIKKEQSTGKEVLVSFQNIASGIYLVVVNNSDTFKIVKE